MSTRDLDLALRIKAGVDGAGSVRQLANEVAELGGDASAAAGKAEELNGELAWLGRTEALVQGVRNAERAVNDQARSLEDLKQKSAEAEAQGQRLESNVAAVGAAISRASAAALDMGSEVQRAGIDVRQAEDRLAGLKVETQRATAESAAFTQQQSAARAELVSTGRALEQARREQEASERTVQGLTSKLEAARVAQRDLSNQVIAADAPTDALARRHQQATDRVEVLQTKLGIAKVRAAELTVEVDRQQVALAGAESGYGKSAAAAEASAARVKELRASVAAATEELSQQRAALSQQEQAYAEASAAARGLERSLKADEAALLSHRQAGQRLTSSVQAAEAALQAKQKALQSAMLSARAAGVETADLASEELRLQVETTRARIAIDDLRVGLQQQKDELAQTATRTKQLSDEQRKAKDSSDALGGGLSSIARGVLAYTGVSLGTHLVGELANQADAVRNVESRLRLATQSQEEFTIAQQGLLRIANDARTSYNETADLYARVIRSTKELNLTQQQQLDVTESISKSLALSGAGTQAQEAALRQLGQALASNVLRGDEFNSVMEQAPRLAQALAAGLHVTTGELRGLAEQGKLTSAQVITALQSQGGAIRAEFAQLDPTINGVIVKIKNNWDQALSEFDKTNGVSERAIAALSAVAENMDELIQLATLAGNVTVAALGIKGVQAIGAYADDLRKAEFSAAALGAAVKNIGLPLALGLVLEYADDLGELAAKWTSVDDAAKATADNRRVQVQAEIDQLTEVVATYLQYAQVRIKTAEEVAALSEQERAAYSLALQNRLQLEDAERRRALRMAELGTATQEQVAQEVASYRQVREALREIEGTQKGILGEITARTKLLVADFSELGAEISKASDQDLAKLAARAAKDLPTASALAKDLGAEFIRAGSQGGAVALELGQRFSDANATVRSLQATLDALRAEQLRRLGVDASAVLSGIDTQAKGLIATFDSLAADSGTDARLIKAAFDELLKKLDTPAELEALKRSLAGVANPAFAAAAAVEEIEKKLASLPAAADTATGKIEELFKKMGLTAGSELDRLAEAAKRDFAAVVEAGAPLGDQQVVFERYAKAALDAAERRGGYALQEAQLQVNAQARTEAQRKTVEELSKKYGELKDRAGEAGRTSVDGHNKAATAAASEYNSIVALINARATLSAADQQRIRDIRAESDALRERNSLVNDANRINNLSNVSASAASINGRGAVGFGQDGINKLREIEAEIERAVSAGRIAADALSETKIDSPDDIRAALRQASQARGQAAALGTVTGSQASEARSLAADLERGAAALERAVERYQQAGLESGDAVSVNPGTGLGQNQIVFQPNPTTPPQTPAPLQPTNQTVNLNLSINGSVPVPLQGSQQAVDQLLRLLEAAGLNSTLGP